MPNNFTDLDLSDPRNAAADLLIEEAHHFQVLQDDDRPRDDAYWVDQALFQVDALIAAGWTPPVQLDPSPVLAVVLHKGRDNAVHDGRSDNCPLCLRWDIPETCPECTEAYPYHVLDCSALAASRGDGHA